MAVVEEGEYFGFVVCERKREGLLGFAIGKFPKVEGSRGW